MISPFVKRHVCSHDFHLYRSLFWIVYLTYGIAGLSATSRTAVFPSVRVWISRVFSDVLRPTFASVNRRCFFFFKFFYEFIIIVGNSYPCVCAVFIPEKYTSWPNNSNVKCFWINRITSSVHKQSPSPLYEVYRSRWNGSQSFSVNFLFPDARSRPPELARCIYTLSIFVHLDCCRPAGKYLPRRFNFVFILSLLNNCVPGKCIALHGYVWMSCVILIVLRFVSIRTRDNWLVESII